MKASNILSVLKTCSTYSIFHWLFICYIHKYYFNKAYLVLVGGMDASPTSPI